jgi:GR25 family glycosyltransferase involved in LPS biosynthesis
MNRFDAVAYINLSYREDRKESILKQLSYASVPRDKIIRIEAHHDVFNGHRGATISHIKALDYAIEKNLNNILILEDDFIFTETVDAINKYIELFFSGLYWDVFFLSAKILECTPTTSSIFRVHSARCAHSYAISFQYFHKLKSCLEFALKKMEKDLFFFQTDNDLHAFDHHWDQLMRQDHWYIANPQIGKQMTSYSDISHEFGYHSVGFPHFL